MKKIATLDGNEIWENTRYLSQDNPWDFWRNMPEFIMTKSEEYHSLKISFNNKDDYKEFQDIINQKLSDDTNIVWHPKQEKRSFTNIRWVSDRKKEHQPKYPIYIPSKGRWQKRPTSDSLISMGIKHFMIVEESQYETYLNHVDTEWVTLIILPQQYLDNYDTFDDLGFSKSKGPGAARNFAWDHSIKLGFKRHWVMDDNIDKFYRMTNNVRVPVADGAIIRAMEDHADQFDNVYMSGPNYRFFAPPSEKLPPFALNTRIYSCNLILNDIPFRWRGRYNEDTDLSLRILKAGYVTIQYYAFLANKLTTQVMSGGNTTEFYSKEGTLPKSKMLEEMHPDVAKVKWHFNRWHHYVDYLPFKNNRLITSEKYDKLPLDVNNYSMEYIENYGCI